MDFHYKSDKRCNQKRNLIFLFNAEIRIDASILESQAAEKTILQYNPELNADKDYMKLINELLKKIKIYDENSI